MKKEARHNLLVKKIDRCKETCKKPKDQRLLGRGSLSANIMLVGIGPNTSYNGMTGRSVFGGYGHSGRNVQKVLQGITEKSKKSNKKSSFWLTNIIKCGCPKAEFSPVMQRCKVFLDEEIDIIQPKVIVLFGGKVVRQVLNEDFVPGKSSRWKNKYLCIHSYHPAARGGLFDERKDDLAATISKALSEIKSSKLHKKVAVTKISAEKTISKKVSMQEKNSNALEKEIYFTPGQREQLEFWSQFEEFVSGRRKGWRFITPYPHYYDIDFGFPKILISCKMNTVKQELHCEIDIPSAHKSDIYQYFLSHEKEIEKEFGERLQWIENARTIRRIRVSREDFDIEETGRRREHFEWLIEKVKKFHKVFSKYKNSKT